MSDARSEEIPEGLSLPRRNRLRVAMWLLLFLAVAAALAAGAALCVDLGARLAQRTDDSDALHESLENTTEALHETALALRAIQESKPSAQSQAAESQSITAQRRLVGGLLVDQAMYARHWESLETKEAFKPIIQDLVQRLSKHEYASRWISPHAADGPNAPRDAFERGLLAQFPKNRLPAGQSPLFAERTSPGQKGSAVASRS